MKKAPFFGLVLLGACSQVPSVQVNDSLVPDVFVYKVPGSYTLNVDDSGMSPKIAVEGFDCDDWIVDHGRNVEIGALSATEYLFKDIVVNEANTGPGSLVIRIDSSDFKVESIAGGTGFKAVAVIRASFKMIDLNGQEFVGEHLGTAVKLWSNVQCSTMGGMGGIAIRDSTQDVLRRIFVDLEEQLIEAQ